MTHEVFEHRLEKSETGIQRLTERMAITEDRISSLSLDIKHTEGKIDTLISCVNEVKEVQNKGIKSSSFIFRAVLIIPPVVNIVLHYLGYS